MSAAKRVLKSNLLPGYFRMIFHIWVTRFNDSMRHDINIKIIFM